jgi:hypothetical protein
MSGIGASGVTSMRSAVGQPEAAARARTEGQAMTVAQAVADTPEDTLPPPDRRAGR